MRKYARKGQITSFIDEAMRLNSDECFCWPFARNSAGYGHFSVAGRHQLAHRFVCASAHGAPPFVKAEAAHLCGNGHLGCINPRHLAWKDRKGNAGDMSAHGRSQRGSRMHASRLTEDDVKFIWMHPEISPRDLAKRFGVTSGAITQIRTGASWKWLTDAFAAQQGVVWSDSGFDARRAA